MTFRWREPNGHDDADADDARLIASTRALGGLQPQGDLTAGWRNSVAQADQRADAQRRRAARAEARLAQVEWDFLWVALLVGLVAFAAGFAAASAMRS